MFLGLLPWETWYLTYSVAARVKPCIKTTTAAQHASPCINYAFFEDEPLGPGQPGKVEEGSTKVGHVGDDGVTIGGATSFKEQDTGILRQYL